MKQSFNSISKVTGELFLPGDKSISHRAVMFSALAKGKSKIANCLNSQDVNSTIEIFQQLGCSVERRKNAVIVEGKGFKGFTEPSQPLNAGNSGTTARLISGILASQNFESVIVGDESLSKRPMMRIVEPLKLMGARIEPSSKGTLPLRIFPSNDLHSIKYSLPVASAQLKSSLLLAGLHLDETTQIVEPVQTRNHTELMLDLEIRKTDEGNLISVNKNFYPEPKEYFVPSDISTAAFFIVLTLLSKNSELKIHNVLLNETRAGVIEILRQMGGEISIESEKEISGEKFGDLFVRSSKLENVKIDKEIIPNIIDEIPILAVAGAFAEGGFEIFNAEELRKKESDRIHALCVNFQKAGLNVEEFQDGFKLKGFPSNDRFTFESFNDHRIAMAFAVFSLLSNNGGEINDFDCVSVSNPDFLKQIKSIVRY